MNTMYIALKLNFVLFNFLNFKFLLIRIGVYVKIPLMIFGYWTDISEYCLLS